MLSARRGYLVDLGVRCHHEIVELKVRFEMCLEFGLSVRYCVLQGHLASVS